jgi:uncharacterized protein with ParB-like and HNH nuclease domain
MEANQTKLQTIIEGTRQFVIPLFQRPYSWQQKQWQDLWDDLTELMEQPQSSTHSENNHFMGAIVTMPTKSVPEGVQKFLLIDGQQRLTTISVLLALLRDKAQQIPGSRLAEEIQETLLINRFKDGNDFYKLMPTQSDRQAYRDIISKAGQSHEDLLSKCYRFFEKKLAAQPDLALSDIKNVLIRNFVLVSITLDAHDNPNAIFETLNYRGLSLTQADLIRNYFLMRIHQDEQEKIFQTYWKPMQDQLAEQLTEFIRHFLMKDGDFVREREVYVSLRQKADPKTNAELVPYLAEISQFAQFYGRIIDPSKEKSNIIRRALSRLGRFDVTTAYPFLLNVFKDYSAAQITESECADILRTVENFIARRYICGVPTHGLNKIFPPLYYQARTERDLATGVKKILSSKAYPMDSEFHERLMNTKLYFAGEKQDRAKFILESLEESFNHHEMPDLSKMTVEHVMPQKLTEGWKAQLGQEWEAVHESLLHTIGNLTLSAYNSELSNYEFDRKRGILANSHIELNRHFANQTKWDEESIKSRASLLADLALKVWPDFGPPERETKAVKQDSSRKSPIALIVLGQRFTVSSWRDVVQKTLEAIRDLDEEQINRIVAEYPKFVGSDPTKFRSNRQIAEGLYIETNLSAATSNRFCIQATQAAGLSPDDWHVEFSN